MALDIRTLVFILCLTHVIQFAVLAHQYLVNRTVHGIGWWLLWSAIEVLAFGCMLLRGIPALQSAAIIAQNALLVLGVMFFYIGILRFFGQKENRVLLLAIYAGFLAGICYFLVVDDSFNTRGVIVDGVLATIAFLAGWALLANRTRSIAASACLLAAVCFAQGGYVAFRMVVQLAGNPTENFLAPTLFNGGVFVDAISVGLLLTFGVILLINQRLNAEMKEAKEEMDLVFNISPDVAVISRLSDGLIVTVNDGYVALSGLRRDECIGTTTRAGQFWKNPADREVLVTELREKGQCRNREVVFRRKDGSELAGLLSAVVCNLQGIPHVISLVRDITKRKQAEAELKISEQRYRQLFEESLDGLCLVDAETGMIIDCNPALLKMMGWAKQELVGQSQRILHPPSEANEETTRSFAQHRQEKAGQILEVPILTKAGEVRTAEIMANVCTVQGRQVMVGIFRDITGRKQAEAELRASQQLTEQIINAIPARVFWKDKNLIYLGCNTAFARDAGSAEPREVVGKDDYQMGWRDQAELYRADDRQVIESDCPKLLIEEPQTTPDGRTITLLTSKIPLRDARGEVTGVLGTYLDVTERKQVEETLRESEERFRRIYQESPVGYQSLDAAGRILDVNPAWLSLLGYSRDEVIGRSFGDFMTPASQALVAERFASFLNCGETHGGEFEMRRQDGEILTIAFDGIFIRDAQGRLTHTHCILHNVTERQRAEEALRAAGAATRQSLAKLEASRKVLLNVVEDQKQAELAVLQLNASLELRVRERTAELEVANKELESFSYSVSHDLRAPLRSIDGFSRILLEDCHAKLDDENRDHLARVCAASQRMGQLIDDLLKLSRLSRSELRRAPVNVSALAREVADELQEAEAERRVEFVLEPGLMASADVGLLRAALRNLLGNAWKFTGKQDRPKIEFGHTDQEGSPAFFVRDNGIGFDMAYADKLFGAFQRLHTTEEFPGTGIGLATVQRAIHRHGGRVWAEGQVNHGAAFYFTLPEPPQEPT